MRKIILLVFLLFCSCIGISAFIICLNKRKSEQFNFNKIIYCFWDTFPLPEHINEYYKHLVNMHPDYKVELYDEMRIKKEIKKLIPYLDKLNDAAGLEVSGWQKTHLMAHKSDLFRIYSLYQNGGIYCDLTTIYKTPIYNIFDISFDGVQGFKTPNKMKKFDIIENGYICAPKGDRLIKLWYKEFLKAIDMGFDKYKLFFVDKYPKETEFHKLLPYLTQHATLYNILNDIPEKDRRKYIKIFESVHYELHNKHGWDDNKIIHALKNNDIDKIKLIKISGKIRGEIDSSDLKKLM